MYHIKQSMDAVNYGAYFYEGSPLSMFKIVDRAATFGYEGVDLWPHRPLAFPLDWKKDDRKKLLNYAKDKGIRFAAVDACTNYMRPKHILVPGVERELSYLKECCDLARDLECPVVRILPAFIGYFWDEYWDKGYCNTATQSRTIEVSKQEDYLREWEYMRQGITDSGLLAADYGITLALQGHPPMVNSYRDTIDMVEEVNLDNVRIGLDLPLFESQDAGFIKSRVREIGRRMAHSHTLGSHNRVGPGGFVYASEEVVPGEGVENWLPFFEACRDIGYDGYFAYEQCAPFLMPGHKKPTIDEFDRRQKVGFEFIKSFEKVL
jgi:sugar phosphate isomerase/epimerase